MNNALTVRAFNELRALQLLINVVRKLNFTVSKLYIHIQKEYYKRGVTNLILEEKSICKNCGAKAKYLFCPICGCQYNT